MDPMRLEAERQAKRFEWFFAVWLFTNTASSALTNTGWIILLLDLIFRKG